MTLTASKHELLPITIDPATTVGAVTLAVANLADMIRFYKETIGLTLLTESEGHAALGVEAGVDGKVLVQLEERSGGQRHPEATGLYHLALLLPSRADLANWLKHLMGTGYSLSGASDHLVSEALYLSDPEGNGIEIYSDRPRSEWPYISGKPQIDTIRLDLAALLVEASDGPWNALPNNTKMGHVHLQVRDVEEAVDFYQSVLGFEPIAHIPQAGFISAGGYHHHIGLNTWHSRGNAPAPEGALGLVYYVIALPNQESRAQLLHRLEASGYEVHQMAHGPSTIDPSGNRFILDVS